MLIPSSTEGAERQSPPSTHPSFHIYFTMELESVEP